MADVIAFPDRKLTRHTVLLVDDEYLMRGVLAEVLEDAGFAVIAAASAEEAMTHLEGNGHIDLVFSDIKMPGADGFTLAKWVHQNHPDLPVILASGYAGKTNIAAELCEAEFLRKPCDFDLIVTKVKDAIARRKAHTG